MPEARLLLLCNDFKLLLYLFFKSIDVQCLPKFLLNAFPWVPGFDFASVFFCVISKWWMYVLYQGMKNKRPVLFVSCIKCTRSDVSQPFLHSVKSGGGGWMRKGSYLLVDSLALRPLSLPPVGIFIYIMLRLN